MAEISWKGVAVFLSMLFILVLGAVNTSAGFVIIVLALLDLSAATVLIAIIWTVVSIGLLWAGYRWFTDVV